MSKPLAKIVRDKDTRIVIQARIQKTTCNVIDKFASDKDMSRAECIKKLLEKAASWIMEGKIE